MKRFLLSILLACICSLLSAQSYDTLAIQDFEIVPETPTWTFTGPVIYNSGFSSASAAPPNSPIGIGGSRAWETTTNSAGLVLDFANIPITPGQYDTVRVRFSLAAMALNTSSGGPDELDYVLVAISTDNGNSYTNRLRIRGATSNNSFWAYNATGLASVYYLPSTEAIFQPANSGLATTDGMSTCEITFPGSVSQVKVRITARSSSSSDTWLVDNLIIRGETNCTILRDTVNAAICSGDAYTLPSGTIVTAAGTYRDTLTASTTCDSIITTNLAVIAPTTSSLSAAICPGTSYTLPSGTIVSAPGTYQDTITSTSGCDSIITASITQLSNSAATLSDTICPGQTYTLPSGATVSQEGTYNDVIPNAAGCDSTITLNLTVESFNTTIVQTGNTLTSAAGSAVTYQWIDCANGNPISGATNQSFTPTASGSYAVLITGDLCTDTTICTTVTIVGTEPGLATLLRHYPNPTTGQLTLDFGQVLPEAQIRILNPLGQMLSQHSLLQSSTLTLQLPTTPGIYLIEITTPTTQLTLKTTKL